ncbi:MAG: 3-oxoacyl-[acyl-carrier-protein] reductase [Candidatus Syntrophonatronum acetioxidans]|uniref:3-oxoacyl-[acyl-carrier-protein] reductase n=1 Tax=Candidatus Syntrophonatronum acetioxidans TaxID=1795816 RepID=A0A424YC76_9FIRM|nr:MAG: 3-oxoacyl-[acyl-carrier-protein] reductase [Candidatus Syntrophonatronum acetioxidans]
MKDKTALVTGASRGIGKATALALAREGCKVAVNYVKNEAAAQEVVAEIKEIGTDAVAIKGDVASFNESEEMISFCLDKFKRIDILINNAGVTRDSLLMRMKEEDWDKVINANLKGVYNCTKAVIRPMMKQKEGRIINIASVVGLAGNAGQANYAAAKAGIIGFTKSVAREVASRGILVNAIAPGFIQTEMTEVLSPEVQEKVLEGIPLNRFGSPEEVAETAVFLASRANYMTGQVLVVDGGMVMS